MRNKYHKKSFTPTPKFFSVSSQSERGFTLIETLVALTVLTIGMSAVITLISHGLKTVSFYQNQTTAFYLAVEGIEFIRSWRDDNFIQENPWLKDLNDCTSPSSCYVTPAPDTGQPYIAKCNPDCPNLKYSAGKNLYNYSPSAVDTPFSREIQISSAADFGPDEREIVSKVTWQDRYGARNIELKAHIFEWQ